MRQSAEILPFPARPVPEDPQARLDAALAALEEALAQQRLAVGEWRGQISTLHDSMIGLGASLTTYRDSLDAVGEQVAVLQG